MLCWKSSRFCKLSTSAGASSRSMIKPAQTAAPTDVLTSRLLQMEIFCWVQVQCCQRSPMWTNHNGPAFADTQTRCCRFGLENCKLRPCAFWCFLPFLSLVDHTGRTGPAWLVHSWDPSPYVIGECNVNLNQKFFPWFPWYAEHCLSTIPIFFFFWLSSLGF